MNLPKDLKPEAVTAIVDSREQRPLILEPLRSVVSGLKTGDYSIGALEELVTVERKSLDDLLMCIGQERERFDREIDRMLLIPYRMVVVEATWADIEDGRYLSRVNVNSVIGSIISWQRRGIQFMWCHNPVRASRYTAKFLFSVARALCRDDPALAEKVLNYKAS